MIASFAFPRYTDTELDDIFQVSEIKPYFNEVDSPELVAFLKDNHQAYQNSYRMKFIVCSN
jgi:hypothetical protein